MIPSNGKRIRGRSAVTAIDVPSPIHQQAIRAEIARRRFPEGVIPSGNGISRMIEKNINPPSSTANLRLKRNCKWTNTFSGVKNKFQPILRKEGLFTASSSIGKDWNKGEQINLSFHKPKNPFLPSGLLKLKIRKEKNMQIPAKFIRLTPLRLKSGGGRISW